MKIGLVYGLWGEGWCVTERLEELLDGSGREVVRLLNIWPNTVSKVSRALIEEVKRERVDCLVGYSLGGLLALKAAEKLPDQLKAVVAFAPAVPAGLWPLTSQGFEVMRYQWRQLLKGEYCPDEETARCILFNLEGSLGYPIPRLYGSDCSLIRSALFPGLRLDRQIQVPVWTVIGREDHMVPWESVNYAFQKYCAGNSASRLCLKDGQDHTSVIHDPRIIAQAVNFLQQHAGVATSSVSVAV